jgi:hypothetical protein
VKQYFVGGALALALAAVVVGALLLFTDLRVTDQSAKEEGTALFLRAPPLVQGQDPPAGTIGWTVTMYVTGK